MGTLSENQAPEHNPEEDRPGGEDLGAAYTGTRALQRPGENSDCPALLGSQAALLWLQLWLPPAGAAQGLVPLPVVEGAQRQVGLRTDLSALPPSPPCFGCEETQGGAGGVHWSGDLPYSGPWGWLQTAARSVRCTAQHRHLPPRSPSAGLHRRHCLSSGSRGEGPGRTWPPRAPW